MGEYPTLFEDVYKQKKDLWYDEWMERFKKALKIFGYAYRFDFDFDVDQKLSNCTKKSKKKNSINLLLKYSPTAAYIVQ